VQLGNLPLVKTLVKQGAVAYSPGPLLCKAAKAGNCALVQYLVEELNLSAPLGKERVWRLVELANNFSKVAATAVMNAVLSQSEDVVRYLLFEAPDRVTSLVRH